MFTSRAEYRLQLREDNADLRLTETGRSLGVVDDTRWEAFCRKRDAVERELARLRATTIRTATNDKKEQNQQFTLEERLRRPDVDYASLMRLEGAGPAVSDPAVAAQVEVTIKYAGYIDRQHVEIERHRTEEATPIPADFEYSAVRGLSHEVRQRLAAQRPETVGQASRMSGVTPAAIALLLVHLHKRSAEAAQPRQRHA